MATTIRAAVATIAAMTPAATAFARRMAEYANALEEQTLMFPKCMAAQFAREEANHPAYVAQAYACQTEAWATVESLGGSTAMDTVRAHRDAPVVPHVCGSFTYCNCALCDAVAVAQECDKEIRKGVWYHYEEHCECHHCAPITPPVAPVAADLPTRWEVMGEQGADF